MPETLQQMASRMCLSQRECSACPLDGCPTCNPEAHPQIIRDWAAAHPPEEAPNAD